MTNIELSIEDNPRLSIHLYIHTVSAFTHICTYTHSEVWKIVMVLLGNILHEMYTMFMLPQLREFGK